MRTVRRCVDGSRRRGGPGPLRRRGRRSRGQRPHPPDHHLTGRGAAGGPDSSIRDSARATTWVLFLLGSVLLVVAGLLMAASWPSGDVTTDAARGVVDVDTGSPGGFVGGLLLCAFSQAVMPIALISFGVRLGTESTRPAH